MKAILATLVYAALGSILPILNIEVYLVGIATQISPAQAIPVAIAAGVGQAVGKLVWYYSVVRSMDSAWIRRRLENPRRQEQLRLWEERIGGRPWLAAAVLFVSGLVGFPPLMITGVVAGVVRMNVVVFLISIALGRGLQSWLILAGLTAILH